MRTAGLKWNCAKLYGEFAALWFFLMTKDGSEEGAWITVKFSVSIMVCLTQDGYWTCLEHFVRLEMMQQSVTRADMRRRVEVAGRKEQES